MAGTIDGEYAWFRKQPVYRSPFNHGGISMDATPELLAIIDQCLSLNGRARSFSANTALLGALPELDSMAVVALITSIEDRFGVSIDDDEIDGATFASVGSLAAFVQGKLAA
jgi:acyl carrier protein